MSRYEQDFFGRIWLWLDAAFLWCYQLRLFGRSRHAMQKETITRTEIARMLRLTTSQCDTLLRIIPMPEPVYPHRGRLAAEWDLDAFIWALSQAARNKRPGTLLARYLARLDYMDAGGRINAAIAGPAHGGYVTLSALARKTGVTRKDAIRAFSYALVGVRDTDLFFRVRLSSAPLAVARKATFHPSIPDQGALA